MQGQTNKQILQSRLQRRLRNNMTDAERCLWTHLRGQQMGTRFRRQHPFGDYILDFVSLEAKLIVEVDGGQHADDAERDTQRTAKLQAAGFTVLRFWNNDVLLDIESVKEAIWQKLQEMANPSPPRPSP